VKPHKTSTVKIMITDDSSLMRRLLREMFQKLGAATVECADGEEAIELYRAERPDWVVMDIQMKRLDGLSATRRIKEKFPEAMVVVLTQFDSSQLRREARAAGAAAYLLKEELGQLRSLARGIGKDYLPPTSRERPDRGEKPSSGKS